jgi:hypothetical protein
MPDITSNDIDTGREQQPAEQRVINLSPIWSTIKGLSPPLANDAKELVIKNKDVQDAFVRPQFEAILKDAQDRFLPSAPQGIGFRSIMVSTNGLVHFDIDKNRGYDVSDIQTVLEKGTELQSGDILVSRQPERDEDIDALSHHRVFQYLINGVNHILNAKAADTKKLVTPAVIIYDLSQLVQTDGYRHEFKNKGAVDKAILAIYPIDISPAK